MDADFCYYVYVYLRNDNIPYYIGKGKGDRAYSSKHNVMVPDRAKIIFLETNLSDIGAIALERRYIRWYGRKDLGTGILQNRTDGGETAPENLKQIVTEQWRIERERNIKRNMSCWAKGKTKETDKRLYNHSQLLKNRGHKPPSRTGSKITHKTYVCIHCGKVGQGSGMFRWHNDNCKERRG